MPDEKTGLHRELSELFQTYSDNRASFIETKWRDAYNAFHRILDPNKQWKKGEASGWRSTAYLGATKQKVVAAVAIIADVMLPNGKINYALEISPTERESLELQGLPEDSLDDNVEKMKAQIDEQLEKAQADKKLLQLALQAAVYGRGFYKIKLDRWVKGGWRRMAGTEGTDFEVFERFQNETTFPAWTSMSAWDVFWDMEAEKPRDGHGIFHRTFLDKSRFADLKDKNDPWLLKGAIDRVIASAKESSQDTSETVSPKTDSIKTTLNNTKLVEYWGRVSAKELGHLLAENGMEGNATDFDLGDDNEHRQVEAAVTLAGKDLTIIRVAPIDPVLGRPVFDLEWDDSLDSVGATSVADNCVDTQHLLNGVFRSLLDNMNLSGNSMIATKEELLEEPIKDVEPGKNIRIDPEAEDVRQAVQPVTFPDVSNGLLNTLQVVSTYLEEDSNVPRIQQGQEASRSETAFAMSRRLEGSGKYFAHVVRNFDASVENTITWLYDYNMLDPELTEGKGDYEVFAKGVTTFQNRVTRLNGLMQFLNVALAHPEVYRNLKLDYLFRDMATLLDLDPDQVTLSPEEIRARDEQEAAAAQAQAEAQQRDMAQKDAAIKRDESQAVMNMANARSMAEKSKIDQLNAVNETVNQNNGG